MPVPPVRSAAWSNGHTFMPRSPSAHSSLASSPGRCRNASRSSNRPGPPGPPNPQFSETCRDELRTYPGPAQVLYTLTRSRTAPPSRSTTGSPARLPSRSHSARSTAPLPRVSTPPPW